MTHELPTEPGWYLDREGAICRVTADGGLTTLGEEQDNLMMPFDYWEEYAPFTRLVPLSVEDRTLITEALNIAQESVDDYADQFSTVDARLDEGKTRADAAKMRALAARIAPDQNGDRA